MRGKDVLYKIGGKWSDTIGISKVIGPKEVGPREVLWKKTPYPENYEYQYGFSQHGIQLNYLPRQMESIIPPTDTRRRTD